MGRYDHLWPRPGGKVRAEHVLLKRIALSRDREAQRIARVPVPDFDRVDPVPVADLAGLEQVVDRRAPAPPALRLGVPEGLAKVPSLWMGLQAEQFDLVFLDPPKWAKSPYGTVDLVRDYPSVFKPSLLATKPGGRLVCCNNVAQVDRDDWIDQLQRSARKAGRSIKSLEIIQPEADFPSFDNNPPLKIAVLEV